MIRYLQLKLIDYGDKDVENLTKNAKILSRETRRRALQTKVQKALQWEPKRSLKDKAKRKLYKRRRQTFVNDVAPGRKTFIAPAEAAKLTSDESSSSCSPSGLSACAKITEATVPSHSTGRDPHLEREKVVDPTDQEPKSKKIEQNSVGKSVAPQDLSASGLKDDPVNTKVEDKMVSVMGKLAEVVISEYSKAEDDIFILKK